MAGLFPDADSIEDFWLNLHQGKIAKKISLHHYWDLTQSQYSDSTSDQFISMDEGHIVDYEFRSNLFPRQIQGAIEIGLKLLSGQPANKRHIGLIVATEWTDPSFYKFQIGKSKKENSYDVERQLTAIKIGLKISGPALAVDTACASSLYGIELARGLLERKKLDAVIVLGLNLYLHSFLYRGFTKLGALSKTKALKSFDKNADGIVPGEAVCGVLLTTNPENAIAEISGIGLSSDGNEGSPFSPGFEGQITAYKRAYLDAHLSPQEIDYIEAHGTATVLGDETECRSLEEFFKPTSTRNLIVGSSKSNIGHTLAASGLVSIIKAALIIKHKTIPPHIKIDPNPKMIRKGIKTIAAPIKLNQANIKIGVSSFGFGGSNAHIIVQTPGNDFTEIRTQDSAFFINSYEFRKDPHSIVPILEGVPMGPKMQERIDPLQRLALKMTQNILEATSPMKENSKSLSCIFLNNLGGSLSVDFEKKYQLGIAKPELSIEAIASTLPSMLSGFPALLFNFRGHHMLISGGEDSFGEVLSLARYLLDRSEGDIILGIAHQNLEHLDQSVNQVLGVFYLSKEKTETSLAEIVLVKDELGNENQLIRTGEATGLQEVVKILEAKNESGRITIGNYCFEIKKIISQNTNDSEMINLIIQKSQEHKEIAHAYLDLLSALRPVKNDAIDIGNFLANYQKNEKSAYAELKVDESNSYFFDHPLDHVPGILTIHGAEELLHWYAPEKQFINYISIKFTRFLEKNKKIFLHLKETDGKKFVIDVIQENKRAGSLKIETSKLTTVGNSLVNSSHLHIEDKKYLHKYREENILISSLDSTQEEAWTLDLNSNRGPFFANLNNPSALYFTEITRQFVMLLAHLRKGIPLSTKMNLIETEINLNNYKVHPIKLKLKDFKFIETDDFLLADIVINYFDGEKSFGEGRIKAQVVSNEYYQNQRVKK